MSHSHTPRNEVPREYKENTVEEVSLHSIASGSLFQLPNTENSHTVYKKLSDEKFRAVGRWNEKTKAVEPIENGDVHSLPATVDAEDYMVRVLQKASIDEVLATEREVLQSMSVTERGNRYTVKDHHDFFQRQLGKALKHERLEKESGKEDRVRLFQEKPLEGRSGQWEEVQPATLLIWQGAVLKKLDAHSAVMVAEDMSKWDGTVPGIARESIVKNFQPTDSVFILAA